MKRREVLKVAVAAAAAGGAAMIGLQRAGAAAGASVPGAQRQPSAADLARKMPRWRGFNLLEKFQVSSQKPFVESDFAWMAEWGFDFVRLPMDYRCWTDKADPYKFDEKVLREIDQAVVFGRTHKIHVCLNLHRAPGYTVASPPEAMNLWADEEAQKQFDAQWSNFARRCKGVASTEVSFNLVNEPNDKIASADYAKVVRRVVAAIRKEDPDRLVSADGLGWGRKPVEELIDLGIAQSTRGYDPHTLTHYKASWAGGDKFPLPTWPLKQGNQTIDKAWLQRTCIEPWKKIEARGVGVHVGEWGSFNKTPHDVVLAWMRDGLENWKAAGWGWALWNLRGSFGVLDSQRADVTYEDFRGHKLDRKMLELLRGF